MRRQRLASERGARERAPRLPRKRTIAAGLATGATLALLGASALAARTAPAPSRMVLRASDLPPGFIAIRNQTGPVTNGDVIHRRGRAHALKIRRWGRITGFTAAYRQRDPNEGSLPGVLVFAGRVDLFRTAGGAHAAIRDPGSGCRQRGFAVIGLGGNPPVGPDTSVCTRGVLVGRDRIRIFLTVWRNGPALGGVAVTAVEGAVTPLAALTGARKQNRRMTAELRSRD